MKSIRRLITICLATILISCGNDDDTNRANEPLTGFFPKTITTTTVNTSGTSTETLVHNYSNDNRIVSITNSSSNISLEYNENGLVDKLIDNTGSEIFEIEYEGNIITRIVETSSNTVFNVDYNNGTYDSDIGTLTFNTQNQLIETGISSSIEYNTNPGPFAELDFQPVFFFLGGSAVTRAAYFYAKNEVISFALSLAGLLTAETQRDIDGNISRVSFRNSSGQELYTYEIT